MILILVVTPLAIANKNMYGYILRDTDNHQLQAFDVLAKNSRTSGELVRFTSSLYR